MVLHTLKTKRNKQTQSRIAFAVFCIWACTLNVPSICRGSELPVLLVETTTPFSSAEKEQIVQNVPSQFNNPFSDRILSNIIVADISESQFTTLKRAFQNAQNDYYSGEFEGAQTQFLSLHQQLKQAMPSSRYQHPLVQMDRDTLVYLAMLAKERKVNVDFANYLKSIVHAYRRNAVPGKQFPPWIRDAIRQQLRNHPVQSQSVSIKNVGKCELRINGKRQTIRSSKVLLPPGEYTFETICGAKRSFTSVVQVTETPLEWMPLYFPGQQIVIAPPTLTLKSTKFKQADILHSFLSRFALRLDQKKIFVAQKTEDEIRLFIFTPINGVQSQVSVSASGHAPNALKQGVTALFSKLPTASSELRKSPITKRNWAKRPLAWILTTTGISMAGIGVAMGIKHGAPSSREPIIWALQISGATLAISGLTVFLIPQVEADSTEIAIGLQTHFSF